MPWHILAPRAVACDNLHLRASAHHWHMSAFCVIENSSEFPITQKTAANSVICLQISAAVYLLFDLFLLYIWPLRQDHTVVRKFAACSFLKLRKKILDCQVFLLLPGHIIDIYDVAGEEKKHLTVQDLLAKFEEAAGGELANDRMILS